MPSRRLWSVSCHKEQKGVQNSLLSNWLVEVLGNTSLKNKSLVQARDRDKLSEAMLPDPMLPSIKRGEPKEQRMKEGSKVLCLSQVFAH